MNPGHSLVSIPTSAPGWAFSLDPEPESSVWGGQWSILPVHFSAHWAQTSWDCTPWVRAQLTTIREQVTLLPDKKSGSQ